MKKFTKNLSLVMVCVMVFSLLITTLVACGDSHTHDYATWKYDETNHWKECSCGDKDASTTADHIDSDSNGICDVCGKSGMHVHDYSITKFDESNHWKECSCGDKDNSSIAAHFDAGNDGKCDTCDYDEMHVHYYEISDVIAPDWDYVYDGGEIASVDPIDGSAHLTCEDCIDEYIVLHFLPFDEAIEATVQANEAVYYYMYADWYKINSMPEKAVITVGDTTVLEMSMGRYFDASYDLNWASLGNKLTNGSTQTFTIDDEPYYAILFKAYSTDGNISFKLSGTPGSTQETAIEIAKGTEYKGTVGSNALWLKYTPTANEQLMLINGCDPLAVNVMVGIQYVYRQYSVIDMTNGDACYICISGTGEYSIKLDELSDTYRGLSPDYPVIVDGDSIEVNSNTYGDKYYGFTAPAKCTYEVTVTPSSLEYNELTSYEGSYGTTWGFATEILSKDEQLVVQVTNEDESITSYSISVNFIIPQPKDHTFTVNDESGNPVSGITVTIKTDDETYPTGTTDSTGSVTISFVPGEYDIELGGFDTDKFSYASQITYTSSDNYTFLLRELFTKKFTVKDVDGNLMSDIVVILQSMSGDELGRATSDASGIASVKYSKPGSGMRINIVIGNSQYAISGTSDFRNGSNYYTTDMDITVVEKKSLAIGNNSISLELDDYMFEVKEYIFTSIEGGSYTLSFDSSASITVLVYIDDPDYPILYIDEYEGSVTSYEFTLDPGESITFKITSAEMENETDSFVLVLAVATGEDTPPASASLIVGDNSVECSYYGVVYTFTSEDGGSYTLSSTDSNACILDSNEGYLFDGSNPNATPYEFELEAGESITFYMSYNYEPEGYTVTIASATEAE